MERIDIGPAATDGRFRRGFPFLSGLQLATAFFLAWEILLQAGVPAGGNVGEILALFGTGSAVVAGGLGAMLLFRWRPAAGEAVARSGIPLLLAAAGLALFLAWPSYGGWLLVVAGGGLWLAWAAETHLATTRPWTALPLLAVNYLLVAFLYVDLRYFAVTKAHLGPSQLTVFLLLAPQTAGEAMGVSWPLVEAVLVTFGVYLAGTLAFGLGWRWPVHRPTVRMAVAVAVGVWMLVVAGSFPALSGMLPITDFLDFRLRMGNFPMPLPSSWRTPDMDIDGSRSPPVDWARLFPPSQFAWKEAGPRLNLVVLLVESWRADLFPLLMKGTMEAVRSGLWLRNHHSLTNSSVSSYVGLYFNRFPLAYLEHLQPAPPAPFLGFLASSGYRLQHFGEYWETLIDGRTIAGFAARPYPATATRPEISAGALTDILRTLETPGPHAIEAFLYCTHFNYYYPPGFETFTPTYPDDQGDIFLAGPSPDLVEKARNRYRNSLLYTDSLLTDFFREVSRRGLFDTTVFVVLGDHGESLGEDGSFTHCSGPNASQVRVPCLIWAPGLAPGVIDAATSHLDIVPTLAGLMGFTADPAAGVDVRRAAGRTAVTMDLSADRRLVLRRPDRLSLFQAGPDGRLSWTISTAPDFRIYPDQLAWYDRGAVGSLARLIEEDRREVLERVYPRPASVSATGSPPEGMGVARPEPPSPRGETEDSL
ncbi:MAG: LTA synthase family protein [Candidatus Riflebacteria bacterium]|nr:LTA synthase family protein [Candidatus Riflebacteria bacterium]